LIFDRQRFDFGEAHLDILARISPADNLAPEPN